MLGGLTSIETKRSPDRLLWRANMGFSVSGLGSRRLLAGSVDYGARGSAFFERTTRRFDAHDPRAGCHGQSSPRTNT